MDLYGSNRNVQIICAQKEPHVSQKIILMGKETGYWEDEDGE